MVKASDYAYAIGRIRSLELKMCGKAVYDRMISSENLPDAVLCLSDGGYPSYVHNEDSLKSGISYIKGLEEYRFNTVNYIKSFIPAPEIADVFLYPADIANCKILLKASFDDVLTDKGLSPYGVTEPAKLLSCFVKDSFGILPEEIAAGIKEARESFLKDGSGRNVGIIMDRAYHDYCLSVADKQFGSSCKILTGFFRLKADWKNLCTFYRLKQNGEKTDCFREAYIEGNVKREVFEKAFSYEGDTEEGLKSTDFYDFLMSIKDSETGNVPLSLIEKHADDALCEYIYRYSKEAFGVGPVYSYLLGKMSEITNVRLILSGILNGTDRNKIRKSLRITPAFMG